jgi:hypothetical protein
MTKIKLSPSLFLSPEGSLHARTSFFFPSSLCNPLHVNSNATDPGALPSERTWPHAVGAFVNHEGAFGACGSTQ